MSTTPTRRPGGNWSVRRIDKAEHYQTVLYEIDMLRYSYLRIERPPDGARDGDVWAYLESFLVHYRNLLDFFGKRASRGTDLSIEHPETVWSHDAGLDCHMPPPKDLDHMCTVGRRLWEKYEDFHKRDDTISRYLQHCTTYRMTFKEWFPIEMMQEIGEVIELFERHLPMFRPATESALVDRGHFPGGQSMSTQTGQHL